VGPLGIEPRTP